MQSNAPALLHQDTQANASMVVKLTYTAQVLPTDFSAKLVTNHRLEPHVELTVQIKSVLDAVGTEGECAQVLLSVYA